MVVVVLVEAGLEEPAEAPLEEAEAEDDEVIKAAVSEREADRSIDPLVPIEVGNVLIKN